MTACFTSKIVAFISLIFAAFMIPQLFSPRVSQQVPFMGDKTYDSELVSEFSLVIFCTYLSNALHKLGAHMLSCKKMSSCKLTEQILCSAFNLNRETVCFLCTYVNPHI